MWLISEVWRYTSWNLKRVGHYYLPIVTTSLDFLWVAFCGDRHFHEYHKLPGSSWLSVTPICQYLENREKAPNMIYIYTIIFCQHAKICCEAIGYFLHSFHGQLRESIKDNGSGMPAHCDMLLKTWSCMVCRRSQISTKEHFDLKSYHLRLKTLMTFHVVNPEECG